MGIIYFNGKSSEDYGIHVTHSPDYPYPEKDVEFIHVPGRSGDLAIDKGSYKNITISYDISFGKMGADFFAMSRSVSDWLHSTSGYGVLSDTYMPDYYRYGAYTEGASISNILEQAGSVTISFNCKPYLYYKDGDIPITYTANDQGQIFSKIYNPSKHDSRPIIKINGQGSVKLTVGNHFGCMIKSINRESVNSITIDSEFMNCYHGSVPANDDIQFLNRWYPTFYTGENSISVIKNDDTAIITSIEVIPKWRTI